MVFRKKRYLTKVILFGLLFGLTVGYSQDWKTKFDNRLEGNLGFSFDKLKKVSKRTDAYNYIALGYFINANNLMYLHTKDEKYLAYNNDILQEMFSRLEDDNELKWKWKEVKKNRAIVYVDNVVLEGYFYRYLGEYIEILQKNKVETEHLDQYIKILEKGFDKWVKRSQELYNDSYSFFFHIRVHVASNWGVTALYLYKFTKDELYSRYLDLLNIQLKGLLEIKEKNHKQCYVWQSNYKNLFTELLKTKKIGKPIIQDVGHANHVVTYILTSYELHYGFWTKKDLVYLSNTLHEFIWDKETIRFNDNVDGSFSLDSEFKNQGWKQSDGWMKLIKYNKSLGKMYKEYYNNNSDIIYTSSMALQFYVNLL